MNDPDQIALKLPEAAVMSTRYRGVVLAPSLHRAQRAIEDMGSDPRQWLLVSPASAASVRGRCGIAPLLVLVDDVVLTDEIADEIIPAFLPEHPQIYRWRREQ